MSPFSFRPHVEQLDGRCLLSANPAVAISDVSFVEGNSGQTAFVLTVSLSQPSSKEVSVNYATANGSAKTGDGDFIGKWDSLRFRPGETTKTVTVLVKGDAKVEGDETFFLNLSRARNAVLADAQGVGTILNDDAPVPRRPVLDLPGNQREVTVMSRNLYVGTDFTPLFDPSAPGGPILQASLAWNDVKQNDFRLRAEALADEVAAYHPDLIGLTEVNAWYSGPADGGPFGGLPATTVEYDCLEILRGELRERGLHYGVVAEVKTFDEELPIFPDLTKPLIPENMKDFRLIDREVILARTDLPKSQMKLSNVQTGHFVAQQTNVLTVPGFPPVVLESDLGWASVDVKVRGKEFRFITTHLEPEETAPATQVAQAAELLAGPANTRMPVILVGDLNSRADGAGTASYANLIAAGFEDAWSALTLTNLVTRMATRRS